jgi:hypothetical protein
MPIIQYWFGKRAAAERQQRAPATVQQEDTRRELLAMAVRDTLRKHGIPQHWIKAETFSAVSATKGRGMHLRLVVRVWRPDMLAYTVALQRAILVRLIRLDPLSSSWAAGISWRYEPVDDSTCPALPPAGFWNIQVAAEQPRKPLLGTDDRERTYRCGGRLAAVEHQGDFRPTEPMPAR